MAKKIAKPAAKAALTPKVGKKTTAAQAAKVSKAPAKRPKAARRAPGTTRPAVVADDTPTTDATPVGQETTPPVTPMPPEPDTSL